MILCRFQSRKFLWWLSLRFVSFRFLKLNEKHGFRSFLGAWWCGWCHRDLQEPGFGSSNHTQLFKKLGAENSPVPGGEVSGSDIVKHERVWYFLTTWAMCCCCVVFLSFFLGGRDMIKKIPHFWKVWWRLVNVGGSLFSLKFLKVISPFQGFWGGWTTTII